MRRKTREAFYGLALVLGLAGCGKALMKPGESLRPIYVYEITPERPPGIETWDVWKKGKPKNGEGFYKMTVYSKKDIPLRHVGYYLPMVDPPGGIKAYDVQGRSR